MTLTIRCACGATYTIDDDQATTTDGPGDVLTNESHSAPTDQYLGFTTPALGGNE